MLASSITLAGIAFLAGMAPAGAGPTVPDTPAPADRRLVVECFAAAPDIVQPIAVDFDSKGRLLVVESHTHFRPAKYDGPKSDRIRVLEDTDGDGKADRFTTFFEGLTHTMDLAVHPDGSVYVATRNEILRLRDTDNDGKADEKTRLVFFDTKGNYPHNGLCGLSFDARGDLTFGMGENLGADYRLIGSDGTAHSGGGEGGNVYHCTADGKKLRRVATGFWNPFGSGRDIFGRLFVVDNDPDSSPPCRLLHIVEGGDYGFQFRYGRAGRHPFQAWNGELPGTLPMVAGTGESPCEVISYESDGLPEEYRGELLVPAWADHRIERYTLRPNGASFTAARRPFIQGGKDFHPSGLAVAPDGSLFITDWGSKSYELHGQGAVWHMRWSDSKSVKRPVDPKAGILSADRRAREAAARDLSKTEAGREELRKHTGAKDVRVRAAAITALAPVDRRFDYEAIARADAEPGIRQLAVRALIELGDDLENVARIQPPSVVAESIPGWSFAALNKVLPLALAEQDPFLRHAYIRVLSGSPGLLDRCTKKPTADPRIRAGLLLAWRMSGRTDAHEQVAGFLKDDNPEVRLLALKWVSDDRLTGHAGTVRDLLSSNPDPRTYLAIATTQARLDGKPVNENALAELFNGLLDDDAHPAAQIAALRAIPAGYAKLRTDTLIRLTRGEEGVCVEALRALKDRGDAKTAPVVLALAKDVKQPVAVRAQALLTLTALGATDTDYLLELAGGTNAALRQEALRALLGAKLTAKQRKQLETNTKEKVADEALARVLGKKFADSRPDRKDVAAWLSRLEGPADPEAGRRVFEHTGLAGCYKCHQIEGRGANIGPDLSLSGRTERKWLAESLLQPSASVAPHYQAWTVRTTDERTRTGLLVRTYLDESEYIDEKGDRFKVVATDLADVRAATVSIMPDGLFDRLTLQEIRDLLAYLESRR